jgi:hypothetical protein
MPINKARTAAIALYKITDILVKNILAVGNVIKECLFVAGNSLFNEMRNKTEIRNAIKEVQLS